jgi:hypothetical protein
MMGKIEKFWNQTFYNKLRVYPSEAAGVVLIKARSNSEQKKERIT